jgi:hypothetical protein
MGFLNALEGLLTVPRHPSPRAALGLLDGDDELGRLGSEIPPRLRLDATIVAAPAEIEAIWVEMLVDPDDCGCNAGAAALAADSSLSVGRVPPVSRGAKEGTEPIRALAGCGIPGTGITGLGSVVGWSFQ